MEVILIEQVEKLGKVGDVVKVKDGFARNYLLPQGKVLRATNENKKVFEARRSEIEKANDAKREAAAAEAPKIADKFITIIRQAGEDGRLFGSVNARDIAEAIAKELKVEVQRSQIALNQPIKQVGVAVEKVFLHAEVVENINVNVARTKDEAAEAKKKFLNPTPEEDKSEEAVAEKPKKGKKAAKEEATEEAPAAEDSAE